MKTRTLRYALLAAVVVWLTSIALGRGQRSFETYCPFGGVESLWGLFTAGEFSCATGPLNLSMFIAVMALTVVAKKAFCGWACPIGFLGELLGKLGGILWKGRPEVPPVANTGFKLLRYVALAVTLYFTYRTGDLILRGYDPFYAIFSGFGHGTLGWITFTVMGIILVGSVLVPMFFCRYLCPLGATFDLVSRFGLIRVARDDDLCIQCGDCGEACPHDIRPYETVSVTNRDCTNCLECLDACPVAGTLTLKAGVRSAR
jgi:polyferredoxin